MSRSRFHGLVILAFVSFALFLGPLAMAGDISKAVTSNDAARVRLLLSGGADVNERGLYGTPLDIASGQGAVEIMEMLIAAGADIEAEGLGGTHPLHLAAMKNHTAAAKLLIGSGAVIDSRDKTGRTPLMAGLASTSMNFDTAEVLFMSGADLNARENTFQWSALHFAAAKGQVEVAEFLVSKGADVDVRDNQGQTPLDHAIEDHRDEMVKFLRANGAK